MGPLGVVEEGRRGKERGGGDDKGSERSVFSVAACTLVFLNFVSLSLKS